VDRCIGFGYTTSHVEAQDRLATRYSIAAIVARAKRARAVICRLRASVSAELAPCFSAFLLP